MRHESWLHSLGFPREVQNTIYRTCLSMSLISDESLYLLQNYNNPPLPRHLQLGLKEKTPFKKKHTSQKHLPNHSTMSAHSDHYTNARGCRGLNIQLPLTQLQILNSIHHSGAGFDGMIENNLLLMPSTTTPLPQPFWWLLSLSAHNWRAITTDKWVLEIIHCGYSIEFLAPLQGLLFSRRQIPFSSQGP